MANKKKSIGIIFVVLALIVAISATAGVTFAKFVSSLGVNNQKATVAQWGYTITADASKMFGENYGNVENNLASVKATKDGAVVVSATPGKNVVAPGTQGEFTLTLIGTAEVNSILTLDVTELQEIWMNYSLTSPGDTIAELHATYFPITWEINGNPIRRDKFYESTPSDAMVTKAKFATAICNAIEEEYSALGLQVSAETVTSTESFSDNSTGKIIVKIPANTSLNNFKLTISWDWAFHTEMEFNGDKNICDTYDTIFGSEWFSDNEPFEMDWYHEFGNTYFILWSGNKTMSFGLTAQIVQTQEVF